MCMNPHRSDIRRTTHFRAAAARTVQWGRTLETPNIPGYILARHRVPFQPFPSCAARGPNQVRVLRSLWSPVHRRSAGNLGCPGPGVLGGEQHHRPKSLKSFSQLRFHSEERHTFRGNLCFLK